MSATRLSTDRLSKSLPGDILPCFLSTRLDNTKPRSPEEIGRGKIKSPISLYRRAGKEWA